MHVTPERQHARPAHERGYNERLFDGSGLRSFYHLARFKWVGQQMELLGLTHLRLVEIGCFDGRLLDEIEARVDEYVGLDADWEGGLETARRKYEGRADVTFHKTADPGPLRQYPDGHFNAAAALETLEHIPPEMVGDYLDELARVTSGRLFVTVPNELGLIFLVKHMVKRLVYRDSDPVHYSWGEVVAATLRRSDRVKRDEHKGFDYRKLISEIAERFQIERVEGVPRFGLPLSLSATIGIVASPRPARTR